MPADNQLYAESMLLALAQATATERKLLNTYWHFDMKITGCY